MNDVFKSYAGLISQYDNNIDFRIRYENRGGKIIILAPHGGGIERGTSELAKAIAYDDLSFYIFEGLLQKARQNHRLHITSTKFDEPICRQLIPEFTTSLAIHGCKGEEPLIHLGGKDNELKNNLFEMLDKQGYSATFGKGDYAGSSYANICNRTMTGAGVQIELSTGFRRLLFQNWQTRKGRRIKTKNPLFTHIFNFKLNICLFCV
jgi:phage replication-related protein YjqB (UPF0714/DUF867 family)